MRPARLCRLRRLSARSLALCWRCVEHMSAQPQSCKTPTADWLNFSVFAVGRCGRIRICPRTSTGKVRRAAVREWLASRTENGRSTSVASTDWMLALIARITGEGLPHDADTHGSNQDLRLAEDLRLDSLGRVQLFDALEQTVGEGAR